MRFMMLALLLGCEGADGKDGRDGRDGANGGGSLGGGLQWNEKIVDCDGTLQQIGPGGDVVAVMVLVCGEYQGVETCGPSSYRLEDENIRAACEYSEFSAEYMKVRWVYR